MNNYNKTKTITKIQKNEKKTLFILVIFTSFFWGIGKNFFDCWLAYCWSKKSFRGGTLKSKSFFNG